MNGSDVAAQMILRILALLCLGMWAAATVVYGAGDLANSIHNVHQLRGSLHSDAPTTISLDSYFGLSLLTGLAWFLGSVAGFVGVVLGAIQIGLARRGLLWGAAFTVLCLGGIVGAFIVEGSRNTDGGFSDDYYSWNVLGALVFPVIAAVVFVGAWVSVRAPEEPPALSPAR